MSILSNSSASEQLTSKVDRFFNRHRISALLKKSNFFKECGFTCLELFKFIFLLVFNQTTSKFVRGFRMLTLGWSDGNTFIPLCFSLLSSHKKSNRYVEMTRSSASMASAGISKCFAK